MKICKYVCLCILLCITGCATSKKESTKELVWWIDQNTVASSLWFQDAFSYKDGQEIQNAYTDKFHELLEKRKFSYKVIFKYMNTDTKSDSENMLTDPTHAYLKKLKEQNQEIDLFMNTSGNFEDMADLDTYMNEADVKKFYDAMPASYWSTQRVNGHIKFIPNIALYGYRNAYIIDHKLAQESAIDISAIKNRDTLTKAMEKVYKDQNKDIIPFSYQDMENMDVYTDTYYPLPLPVGSYLRYQKTKNGWKVVNLNETKAFKDTLAWVETCNQKQLTGAHLKQTVYEERMQKGTFVSVGRYYPPELQKRQQRYVGKTQLPFGKLQVNRLGGTAVYKDSKHKKEAVQLLAMIDTDKELSEFFIYGFKVTDYEIRNGLVYALKDNRLPDCISSGGLTGNYLIITPSEYMGKGGQKAIRAYMEHIPMEAIYGFYPQVSLKDQQLLYQYYAGDSAIPYFQSKDTLRQLAKSNANIKMTALPRIMNDIQAQLDDYIKGK